MLINPYINPQIQQFLQFVKNMYRDLPNHMSKIFERPAAIRVSDLSEVNVDALLKETFTITPIHTEKKLPDGTSITVRGEEECVCVCVCVMLLMCVVMSVFFLFIFFFIYLFIFLMCCIICYFLCFYCCLYCYYYFFFIIIIFFPVLFIYLLFLCFLFILFFYLFIYLFIFFPHSLLFMC